MSTAELSKETSVSLWPFDDTVARRLFLNWEHVGVFQGSYEEDQPENKTFGYVRRPF